MTLDAFSGSNAWENNGKSFQMYIVGFTLLLINQSRFCEISWIKCQFAQNIHRPVAKGGGGNYPPPPRNSETKLSFHSHSPTVGESTGV